MPNFTFSFNAVTKAASLALLTIVAGCGDSGSSSTGSGAGGGGGSGGGGSTGGACTTGDLCFTVKNQEGSLPDDARLAVMWFQLSDDGDFPQPDFPVDQPLAKDAAEVGIPLSSITPPSHRNVACERASSPPNYEDPCAAPEEFGFAYVIVRADEDGDGKIDFSIDTFKDKTIGIGQMLLVSSNTEIAAGDPTYGEFFTEGVSKGIAAYDLKANDGRDLIVRAADDKFDLVVCASGVDACDALPNIN